MSKEYELLTCPFCGGDAALERNASWDYFVRCKSCRVRTRQHHENSVGAVLDWNRREDVNAEECCYIPDESGFTWYDDHLVEHYEEDSASDGCSSASCDKCGNKMMVGDDGWFRGWDEIKVWYDEAGAKHHGYVLDATFAHCPGCGRRVCR